MSNIVLEMNVVGNTIHFVGEFDPCNPANFNTLHDDIYLMARDIGERFMKERTDIDGLKVMEFSIVYDQRNLPNSLSAFNRLWMGRMSVARHDITSTYLTFTSHRTTIAIAQNEIQINGQPRHASEVRYMRVLSINGAEEGELLYVWDMTHQLKMAHTPVNSLPVGPEDAIYQLHKLTGDRLYYDDRNGRRSPPIIRYVHILLDGLRDPVRRARTKQSLEPSFDGYEKTKRALMAFDSYKRRIGEAHPEIALPMSELNDAVLDSLAKILRASPTVERIALDLCGRSFTDPEIVGFGTVLKAKLEDLAAEDQK